MNFDKNHADRPAPDECKPFGLLRVYSPELVAPRIGEIVEAPSVLVQFQTLCEAVADALGNHLRLGEIRVTESYYLADVFAIPGLGGDVGCAAELDAFLDQLEDGRVKLEINATREQPKSAEECGVASMSLDVLRAVSYLAEQGHHIEVAVSSADPVTLPMPNSKAFMALPTSAKHPDKKIDGELTGIGVGDARGSRIEIYRKSMYILAGLNLDDAWRLLSDGTRISGTAKWDHDAYLISHPVYTTNIFGRSGGQ